MQGGLFFREGGNNAALYPEPQCPYRRQRGVQLRRQTWTFGSLSLQLLCTEKLCNHNLNLKKFTHNRICERPGICITRTHTRCVSCTGTAAPSSVPVALTGHLMVQTHSCQVWLAMEENQEARKLKAALCTPDSEFTLKAGRICPWFDLSHTSNRIYSHANGDPHGSSLLEAEDHI